MQWPEPEELYRRALSLPAIAGVARRLDGQESVRAAVVGGAVRDLLLELPVEEIDMAVEGPVEAVVAQLGEPARRHIRFGTATVEVDGSRVDLARTRRETYPRPGALPEVEPATLEQDLERRDFTVNAMALEVAGGGAGRLLVPPGAREDLEHGRLRILHRGSFIDDPTRLFRLARYRARLDFEAEPETAQLAGEAVAGGAVETLSGPRIGHELELIGAERDPVAVWGVLRELGLDEAVCPGFGIGDQGLARAALALLPVDGRAEFIVLGLALDGVHWDQRAALLDRLGFPAEVRAGALIVASRGWDVASALHLADSASEIHATLAGPAGVEMAALAGALGEEAPARWWLEHLRHLRLQIGGDDLLAAGVQAGPAVGAGLAAARAALLEGRADSREDQLAEALRVARDAG